MEISTVGKAVTAAGDFWGWEVAVYLFLGGMAAGFSVLSGLVMSRDKESDYPVCAKSALLSPIIINVGMLFLFMDLEYKLHIHRFYMTFRPSSPMSWGSWILPLLVAAGVALGMLALKGDMEKRGGAVMGFMTGLTGKLEPMKKQLAWLNVFLGVAVGIYTGILLGSFAARPLWNSPVLCFLFLFSGVSTGTAALLLLAKSHTEKDYLRKLDLGFIALESVALFLLLAMHLSSDGAHRTAAMEMLSGVHLKVFVLIVAGGLVLPFLLEGLELKKKMSENPVAPLLVLCGGLALRFLIVYAGQNPVIFY